MVKEQPKSNKGLPGGQYKPLTDEQVEQIHQASLAILTRTGVKIEEPQSLRLFKKSWRNN